MRVKSGAGQRLEHRGAALRARRHGSRLSLAALLSVLATGPLTAETLRQAMASAYQHNPRLDAERARLRATDEEVPRAKAGFRPQITGSADTGRQRTTTDPKSTSNGETNPWGYQLNIVQPLFRGFRTVSAVNEAEANVRAGRERCATSSSRSCSRR